MPSHQIKILMTFLMTIILYNSKSYILVIKIIKIIEVQNFSFYQPVKAYLIKIGRVSGWNVKPRVRITSKVQIEYLANGLFCQFFVFKLALVENNR